MKIGDLARRCGLGVHTIRYYEKIGLLPPADRDAGGRRDYDAEILTWIAFVHRLKTTGMPIRDMLIYARLRELGPQTADERRALLERHHAKVVDEIKLLQSGLAALDAKIALYAKEIP